VNAVKKAATRKPSRRPSTVKRPLPPPKKAPTRAPRESARERQLRERAERAEALLKAQEQKLAEQERQVRALRTRQRRAAAKAQKEERAREKERRAELSRMRAETKKRDKQLAALRAQQAQTQKRIEQIEKAAAPPPTPLPPPEPEKPKKGKKGRKKKEKPIEVTDDDAIILASWDNLSHDQQQASRLRLSPAGRKELDRRTAEQLAKKLPPGVTVAKSPEELRLDLQRALKRKGAKNAIATEVNNAIVRTEPVPAWEDQHRATMRHPNMIVQTDKEAIKAANKGAYPKRERKGTRYHATIVAVTQHPPLQKYGPTSIDGYEDLFVMYVSAQGATSRTGIKQNVAAAIRDLLDQQPGGAPIFIAAIEVRTSRRKP